MSSTETAAVMALPTRKDENWRYVNVKVLTDISAAHTQHEPDAATALIADLPAHITDGAIVMVDGRIADGTTWPSGIQPTEKIQPLLDSFWQEHRSLDQQISWVLDGTTPLNLAVQGIVDKPLKIVALHRPGSSAWSLQLQAARGAAVDCEIIHVHLGHADQVSREDCAVGIHAADGAAVRVSEITYLPHSDAQHQLLVSRCLVAEHDSSIAWSGGYTGAQLERHIALGHCYGIGSSVSVAAATLVDHHDQSHHLVRMRHHQGNSTSRQQYHTIVNGHGRSSFDGVIRVDIGADGTDANQHSGNLQLSPTSKIATRPQLDIYADDVIASHGATVGQPDADEIAYLISRGLNRELATALITDGHLREALADMASASLRQVAETTLLARLRRQDVSVT